MSIAVAPPNAQSRLGRMRKVTAGDPGLLFGAGIVLVVVVVAIGAPWLAPYSPTKFNLETILAGPSAAHLLGTDELGRDLLSRVMYGSRVARRGFFVGPSSWDRWGGRGRYCGLETRVG